MLPASAPLLATPPSESILFTVKGGGGESESVCVYVSMCVWQVVGSTLSQQALFFSLHLPEGSPRLSIVRLVSEPVWHRGRQVIGWIALYDVWYDNISTFPLSKEGVVIPLSPWAPSRPFLYLYWRFLYLTWEFTLASQRHPYSQQRRNHAPRRRWRMSSSIRRRAVAPDNADDDEEPLTRSTPAPVSWHEPPAAIASAGRHQGGCWDTLQWFTYYNWLRKCVTHTHTLTTHIHAPPG